MNLSEQDTHPTIDSRIIYAAGYFDGEGCIWVGRSGTIFTLGIGIQSGDLESLLLFSDIFGGKVRSSKSESSKKNIWDWRRTGHSALVILRSLSPFLIAKKDQAYLVICSKWSSSFKKNGNRFISNPSELVMLRMQLKEAKTVNIKKPILH